MDAFKMFEGFLYLVNIAQAVSMFSLVNLNLGLGFAKVWRAFGIRGAEVQVWDMTRDLALRRLVATSLTFGAFVAAALGRSIYGGWIFGSLLIFQTLLSLRFVYIIATQKNYIHGCLAHLAMGWDLENCPASLCDVGCY
ncbi:hypothetical protein IT412_01810 [Candidatus Peregrinibacteria bacterium]|nr:hypothetical protein [Candidatus Peregrinibacteria bacterium]